MNRFSMCAAALVFFLTNTAYAHVTVQPRESTNGVEQRYTIRVPTEGESSTTSVRLEIPDGVTVLDITQTEGVKVQSEKQGDRIIAITWTAEIKPKQSSEFSIRVKNPSGGSEIAWKAHQHFADGTVADWTGPFGSRRPAATTRLSPGK
jgi:uncharacterized protein YcnI